MLLNTGQTPTTENKPTHGRATLAYLLPPGELAESGRSEATRRQKEGGRRVRQQRPHLGLCTGGWRLGRGVERDVGVLGFQTEGI